MLIERKWLESNLGVRVNFFLLAPLKKGSRSSVIFRYRAENQEKNVNFRFFDKGKEIRIQYTTEAKAKQLIYSIEEKISRHSINDFLII